MVTINCPICLQKATYIALEMGKHYIVCEDCDSRFEICWMSWAPIPPSNDLSCFHCGEIPVVDTWVVNSITVGICARCKGEKPMAGTRSVTTKIGCKKCEYTGFSFGRIPCECREQ